jgi:hypothetical protein
VRNHTANLLKKGLNLINENSLRYQQNTEITIPSAASATIIWKYFVLMVSNRVGYEFPWSKTTLKKVFLLHVNHFSIAVTQISGSLKRIR